MLARQARVLGSIAISKITVLAIEFRESGGKGNVFNPRLRVANVHCRLLIGSAAYVEAKKEELRPSEVKLLPNYPNPFAKQTTIEYALPEARAVRLAVYDVLGRQVVVLQEGRKEGGFHRVQWQAGRGLSSGVYFVRLRAGDQNRTQRLTVVR